MPNQTDPIDKPTLWRRLWRVPTRWWLLGIPFGAYVMFVVGAVVVIGSQVAIHATGTEEFCTSACHSMEAFTTPEWKNSPHYLNPSGVRATCSDCHIPHSYPQIIWRKAESGLRDAYHELKGTISTREKYEAHRAEMAEKVWAYMEATDSRECRSCHEEEYFALHMQDEKALQAHLESEGGVKTCIECHKGIAHKTPDEYLEESMSVEEGAPVEEGTSIEEETPAEEGAPAEEGTSIEEETPAEERAPAEEGTSIPASE